MSLSKTYLTHRYSFFNFNQVMHTQIENSKLDIICFAFQRTDVVYTCLNISGFVDEVKTDLWTLGEDMAWNRRNSVLTAKFGKYSHTQNGKGSIERGKYICQINAT